MDLLFFFALPLATIILAIIFQKILKSPILVGLLAFAIYLIVTFAAFDTDFLVLAIIYTALAFITAYITKIICNFGGSKISLRNLNVENLNSNTSTIEKLSTETITSDEITTDTLNANQIIEEENNCNCCNSNNRSYRTYNGYNRIFRR